MSLGYPAIRPTPDGNTILQQRTGPFGVPEVLVDGFQQKKNDISINHPLEFTEKQYSANLEKMDFTVLRNAQGLHAPMRLKMERQIAGQIQRLPGLHSSNLMSDILTGRSDVIDFTDILNDPMDAEMIGNPHMLMERRLGL